MNLTDIDTHNNSQSGHFIGNLLLIFFAVVFDFIAEISVDDIYKWSYRGIAIISLIALAYVNIMRAVDRFKGKKQP